MGKNVMVSRAFLSGVKTLMEMINGDPTYDKKDFEILCRLITAELEKKYEAIERREEYTNRIRINETKT